MTFRMEYEIMRAEIALAFGPYDDGICIKESRGFETPFSSHGNAYSLIMNENVVENSLSDSCGKVEEIWQWVDHNRASVIIEFNVSTSLQARVVILQVVDVNRLRAARIR
jgi:hypothetical protein